MKNLLKYKVKTVKIEELRKSFRPTEIIGYCSQCPNYGNVWSCPPHDFDLAEYTEEYEYITIIGLKIYVSKQRTKDKDIKEHYGEIFLEERSRFGDKLLNMELELENARALIAGNCYHCDNCTREFGKECVKKDKLRYSLEAIGYSVSDICSEVLNEEIQWFSDEKVPDYLLSIGAILTKDKLDDKKIKELL